MRAFDSSSIIHAWDNYPPEQFENLWNWLATQVASKNIFIPQPAYKEVRDKNPECADWLDKHEVEIIPISSAVLHTALAIKQSLGIKNDQYSSGVGENDIIIIATAMILRCELISNERRQNTLPIDTRKYKIPAVCNLQKPSVSHLEFIEYIKRSKEKF